MYGMNVLTARHRQLRSRARLPAPLLCHVLRVQDGRRHHRIVQQQEGMEREYILWIVIHTVHDNRINLLYDT